MSHDNGEPEIFHTLQGEGKNLGKRAVFMRTSDCNLHCVWCDTPYTWNWEGTPWDHLDDTPEGKAKYNRAAEQINMSPAEVADSIMRFDTERVVFTGGEPLLQQRNLIKVMAELKDRNPDYQFEVETNGTFRPLPDFDALCDQYNVSPKLANSNNKQSLREKPEVYEYYVGNPKAIFKFVIAGDEDLPEITRLVQTYEIPADQIYLMPEGRTEEEQKIHGQIVAEICKDRGYTMAPRLHVAVWGAKRGV